MGTKETLTDLRTFETGLSQYRARLEACWKKVWNLTLEERALVATDRGRLQREYGALRVAIATAHDGVVPHFGYANMGLGEMGQIALSDPYDNSSVMDALDNACQMVSQAIGYFESIEREEQRPKPSPMSAPAASPPAPAEHMRLGERSDPMRNRIGEALIVTGALLFGYPWQGFVLPPPTALVPYIAAAGLVLTLVGLVLRLVSPSPGKPRREPTQAAKIEAAGDGTRQASNVAGSGNTVTQASRDVIGVQNIHAAAPVKEFGDEAARRRDIEFAHRLNEKYEDGVHRILNHPFQSEQAVFKFKEMAEEWTDDVAKDLRAHPCTPHEITRFRVLQEVPRDKHFHQDPAWDDLKQQFNERLNRLRWLVERYGERPPV